MVVANCIDGYVVKYFSIIIDKLALQLGVNYPPTLLFILGMILVKVISIDLHQSSQEKNYAV